MWAKSVLPGFAGGHWLAFATDQLQRIGLALAPYAVTRLDIWWRGWALLGAAGLATLLRVALAVARRGAQDAAWRRAKAGCLALAPLAVAGLVWATGMRGNLFSYRWQWGREHRVEGWDIFEAMFHVGVPLALFSLIALLPNTVARRFPRPLRRTVAAALVATLCLAFMASAFHMGRLGRDAELAKRERVFLADIDAVRRAAAGRRIYAVAVLDRPLAWSSGFLLANHVLVWHRRAAAAEFVVAPRMPGGRPLTPGNRCIFLYAMEDYLRHCAAPRLCAPMATGEACRR